MAKVNDTCIGCQLCTSIAPEIFEMTEAGLSHAIKQPENDVEQANYESAKSACPVAAIEDGLPDIQMPTAGDVAIAA